MELTLDDLRGHYASLSDEALLALHREELTTLAQQCYDVEISKRNIQLSEETGAVSDDNKTDIEPDWIGQAACAASFDSLPGLNPAPDFEEARSILEAADIPCHLRITGKTESTEPEQSNVSAWELLVPGGLILPATSILDREFFNARLEEEWRTHLQDLSDEDFRSLRLEELTAGLLDRVERLKRSYLEERERRRS